MSSFRLIISAVFSGLLWLATTTAANAALPGSPSPIRCVMDEAIPTDDRAELEALATTVGRHLKGNEPEKVILMLTPEGRTPESRAFGKWIGDLVSKGDAKTPAILHSYLVRLNGGDATDGAICGDPTRPMTRVRVSLGDAERQAYVILSIQTINNDLGIVMMFQRDTREWVLYGLHAVVLGASNRSAVDFAELGRAQAKAGKTFNATMMFNAALTTLDRGPNMTLLMRDDLAAEFSTFQAPPELAGSAPYAWTLGKKSYLVRAVTVLGLEGSLTLKIEAVLSPWSGDQEAIRESRVFVEAFIKAHPEWRDVFENIVLQAISPAGNTAKGGAMYGTVYNRDTGFLADD